MKSWRTALLLTLATAFAGLLIVAACSPAPRVYELNGHTMGTTWQVRLVQAPPEPERLRAEIEATLLDIERQMSTWREDSEITRFNLQRTTDWVPVSPEFVQVLDHAMHFSDATSGALDVTLRPLALAWGFQGDAAPRVPAATVVDELLANAGMANLELDRAKGAVRKRNPDTEIDLSAIAKGFAVDRMAERVAAWDMRDYLVEIGGEIRVSGHRPGGGPWRVALEAPSPEGGLQVLALADEAVATSGDYRNFFRFEGKRYAHVLDPATGRPAEHGAAVITVVAGTTVIADALATAFMAMTPEAALETAQRLQVAAQVVTRNGDAFDIRSTASFRHRLVPRDG